MPTYQILYFLALSVCVATVGKYGQRDEWAGLAGVVVATLISPVVQRHAFDGIEFGIMAVDLALLAWLTAISLRSSRYWPLFAAGFHLAGCAVHLAPFVGAGLAGVAYGFAVVGASYFVLAAITLGAAFEASRKVADQ